MQDRLKQLIELRRAAGDAIDTLKEERKAIAATALDEGRDLTDVEDAEFRAKTKAIADKNAEVDGHSERIAELETEMLRAGTGKPEVEDSKRSTITVTEPLTYQKGNGQSYFRDLARVSIGVGNEAERDRLARHSVDVSTNDEIRSAAKVGTEYRNLDRNDGTGGYAVPPLWMMNRFIELARAGRTYANLIPTEGLPAGTDSINIPKINTGTAVAIQTADNATISEVDLTDTSVNAQVKTIAGQQGLAIQLIDQSPVAFDELVFRDLAGDYAVKFNQQVINGSGTANQIVGVRNTAGIVSLAATDAGTETSKGQTIWKKIADAIQRIYTSRFQSPEVIVMHPRRWAAFTAMLDANGRPLVVPNGPADNQLGEFGGVVTQQFVGTMHGLPVVTDPGLPTNLGAGTNQDVIHVLKASDLVLFESSVRTRALQETRATTLTVLLQVYGYLAFTAGRFPQSVVEIGGTALTAPTFA